MARGKESTRKKSQPKSESYLNKEITIYRGAAFIKNKQGRRLYLENYDIEPRTNERHTVSVQLSEEIEELSNSRK